MELSVAHIGIGIGIGIGKGIWHLANSLVVGNEGGVVLGNPTEALEKHHHSCSLKNEYMNI